MVNSLLTAIVRADGDALVMHVGERPYVVASHGPVELSSRPLTMEAVAGMLGQLLPSNSRRALDELGAIEFELPKSAGDLGDRFTVVAARGGDDIWIEVRRHRKPVVQKPRPEPALAAAQQTAPGAMGGRAPAPTAMHAAAKPAAPVPAAPLASGSLESPAPAPPPPSFSAGGQRIVEAAAAPSPAAVPPVGPPVAVRLVAPAAVEEPPASTRVVAPSAEGRVPPRVAPLVVEAPVLSVPTRPASLPPGREPASVPTAAAAVAQPPGAAATLPPPAARASFEAVPLTGIAPGGAAAEVAEPAEGASLSSFFGAAAAAPETPAASAAPSRDARTAIEEALEAFESAKSEAAIEPLVRPLHAAPVGEYRPASETAAPALPPVAAPEPVPSRPTSVLTQPSMAPRPVPAVSAEPAVVLPLARNPIRMEQSARSLPSPRIAGIDRLLRLSAARGANTLYLMSQARPSVRVDGEIAVLEGEPILSAPEVESLLLDLAPERSREALAAGEGTEWMSEVPEVGRIRCQSFRDHRGPGGIFRMISARPTSAEQLGLAREIQALCAEPEGLVLVAGPRASGKSTLVSALVDLINRTRNDYVITVESQIKFAHESRGCLVSQREVRGGNDDLAMVVRAALRENPDVLVIEDMRSAEVVHLAVEAMEAGHLVIGAVSAHGAAAAIGRVLDQFPEERRPQVQLALAEGLRGVVSQVLLRKTAGGRVAAREILLNMPSIANLIAEGRISQLPLAIDSGRKHGMVPLNDALAAFVQSGVVDAKEAYRKAFERQAFLAVLRREGVDTSFVERLA